MLMKGKVYGFMSNMFACHIEWEGRIYKSSETVYQMMKCERECDKERFKLLNGFEAKRLGRVIRMREDWHEVKVDIMRKILKAKFNDECLMERLREVEEPIVEDNYWNDTYWGVCKGRGKNMLGKLLTEIKEGTNVPNR